MTDEALKHPNEDMRAWAVRLITDRDSRLGMVPWGMHLVNLAKSDSSPMVRNQLACTARRLRADQGLPIVQELLKRGEDVDDPQIPMLLWWAIEDKAIKNRDAVLALFDQAEAWKAPITEKFIIERIGRRYLSEGDYAACARLLNNAPSTAFQHLLIKGMDKALEGRRLESIPEALVKPVSDLLRASRSTWGSSPSRSGWAATRLMGAPSPSSAAKASRKPTRSPSSAFSVRWESRTASPRCSPTSSRRAPRSAPRSWARSRTSRTRRSPSR
jgi:hypothetical protein